MKAWIGAALLAVSLLASWPAYAEPIRILIAASHAGGAPGELPLQHAAADVDHVQGVLTSLGDFRAPNEIRLVDPTLAELAAAFDRARQLAAGHAPDEVTFLFYFSGHGDRDRIHLGAESIAMTDLAARVRAVPASLRLLVTDACRNYGTRTKGVSTEPGFAIATAPGDPSDGVVWLFAAGEGEPAQESDELEGALFTHYWVSGLRGAGDTNGDGQVTLAESYDFAYSQTVLRSARSGGVLQHPAAVFDLHEAAPIVLTKTYGAGTAIRLPQGTDVHYLVYAIGARAVLGETWASADRETVFALPAGHYLIQRRDGAGSAGLDVSLSGGETRALHAADFRPIAEEQLASKGGTMLLRPNELSVGGGIGASRLSSFGELVGLRYGRSWSSGWTVSVGIAGALGTQSTSAEDVKLVSVGADAIVEHRWRAGPLLLGVGAGAEADVIVQTLDRTDAARVAAAGYPTTQSFTGFAPGPVGAARLRAPLTSSTWVELDARAGVLFPNLDGGVGAMWTARGGVGVGVDF